MANKANYHLLATSRSELRAPSNFLHPPQSLRDSPLGGTGDRIPQTPCVASLRVRRLLSEHIPPSYGAEGGHGCKEVIIRFGSILVIHLLII